jgi:hypothetical protein
MCDRKYLPSLAELIDKLSILQLKENFLPEHREHYAKEIKDIAHDISLILSEKEVWLNGEAIRAIVVLAQSNLHIWHNESNVRNGVKEGNDLALTHSLNGVRNRAKNKIEAFSEGRVDHKVDCIAADASSFEPSW